MAMNKPGKNKKEVMQKMPEVKIENKEPEKKKAEETPVVPVQKKERPKRKNAVVNASNIPISTKHAAAICKFIKGKRIQKAIEELEQVAKLRKPIPMTGEIPHRKGDMMSGRFPQKASKEFIILLKSLSSNSIYNGLEDPIVTEAFANIGARPFGRGGVRKKRTHIRIVAENKSKKEIK